MGSWVPEKPPAEEGGEIPSGDRGSFSPNGDILTSSTPWRSGSPRARRELRLQHTRQAQKYQTMAQAATQLGLTDTALKHEGEASYHTEKAQEYQLRLDELGATHVLQGWLAQKARINPAGPSGS